MSPPGLSGTRRHSMLEHSPARPPHLHPSSALHAGSGSHHGSGTINGIPSTSLVTSSRHLGIPHSNNNSNSASPNMHDDINFINLRDGRRSKSISVVPDNRPHHGAHSHSTTTQYMAQQSVHQMVAEAQRMHRASTREAANAHYNDRRRSVISSTGQYPGSPGSSPDQIDFQLLEGKRKKTKKSIVVCNSLLLMISKCMND